MPEKQIRKLRECCVKKNNRDHGISKHNSDVQHDYKEYIWDPKQKFQQIEEEIAY